MNARDTSGSILEARLSCAARGWETFPAKIEKTSGGGWAEKSHKSKKHSGTNWGKTRDEAVIKADVAKWPNQLVGIATGPDSGIFVIDVDTKEGHDVDGDASLRKLEAKHGPLPVTLTAVSPSGSRHFYFQWPAITISNSSNEIAQGIDVRGDGGMVIAPPSVVPGKGAYEWLNDEPVAEAPSWLLELTSSSREKERRRDDLGQLSPELLAAAEACAGQGLSNDPDDMLDMDRVRAALKVISPTHYDQWWRTAAALKNGIPDEELGFGLFDAWSKGTKKDNYSWETTKKKWHEISDVVGIGIGTLYRMADEADPGWWWRFKSERREEQRAHNAEIGEGISTEIIADMPTILTLNEMRERLVWIGEFGAVADRVTGKVRKKEVAHTEYAASKHRFSDKDGKNKEVPALKLWLEIEDRQEVDVMTWFPGRGQICPTHEEGKKAFNSWRGLPSFNAPPDWRRCSFPFLRHVSYLVPKRSERKRFLRWLAHIIKHPEVLPHTCYLMTTPTTGIGRNLLASILVRVLHGYVASGVDLPELLDGGFNGRLSEKLMSIVDEAKEGGGEKRFQRAEKLKLMITQEYRQINPKYGVQRVEKNCCRWLMFSNHNDAIPFDNKDRRIIVIANPTMARGASYYARLYASVDDTAFIASVRKLLEEIDIGEFNPGEHAPENEAKKASLDAMMSDVERAVVEFKEECTTELTTLVTIKNYVHAAGITKFHDYHLAKAIERAGMISTKRRLVKDKNRSSVVIVRGDLTVELVMETAADVLEKQGAIVGAPRWG